MTEAREGNQPSTNEVRDPLEPATPNKLSRVFGTIYARFTGKPVPSPEPESIRDQA